VTKHVEGSERGRDRFEYPSAFVVDLVRAFAWATSKIFWSISFNGLENIPPPEDGGLVVVSNHPTYFDPAWISLKLRRPLRFMAWDQAVEWKFIGPVIRYLGAIPIKLRSGPAKSTIVESIRSLRDGAALVIFPEGEREFADGRMHPFKSGAVHIAMMAGVPILPVTVKGGSEVWPQGQKYPHFFRHVEISYHALVRPMRPDNADDLDDYLESVNLQLKKTIADAV
jgi:1-acyl-sn-glycerol-3-phosphate acyltransferase